MRFNTAQLKIWFMTLALSVIAAVCLVASTIAGQIGYFYLKSLLTAPLDEGMAFLGACLLFGYWVFYSTLIVAVTSSVLLIMSGLWSSQKAPPKSALLVAFTCWLLVCGGPLLPLLQFYFQVRFPQTN